MNGLWLLLMAAVALATFAGVALLDRWHQRKAWRDATGKAHEYMKRFR